MDRMPRTGLSFHAGLDAVDAKAPADRRVAVAAIAAPALTTLTPSRKRSTQAAPALSHPTP